MFDQEKVAIRRRFQRFLLAAFLAMPSSQAVKADTIQSIDSPLDALASTAAVVEGYVTAESYTFHTAAGPRNVATLTDVTTHLGRYGDSTLQVATLGGPVPGDRWLFVPELPRLTEDTHYLVFLANSSWFFTPVVENYVFRIELNGRGTEVLISPTGHAVVGVSAAGLELSADPVLDTQIDFLTPNARLRVIDSAPLANAMSKANFLAAIRDLARTVPLQGDFRTSPASDRVWDRIETVGDAQ